jgi:hypothetical protein
MNRIDGIVNNQESPANNICDKEMPHVATNPSSDSIQYQAQIPGYLSMFIALFRFPKVPEDNQLSFLRVTSDLFAETLPQLINIIDYRYAGRFSISPRVVAVSIKKYLSSSETRVNAADIRRYFALI